MLISSFLHYAPCRPGTQERARRLPGLYVYKLCTHMRLHSVHRPPRRITPVSRCSGVDGWLCVCCLDNPPPNKTACLSAQHKPTYSRPHRYLHAAAIRGCKTRHTPPRCCDSPLMITSIHTHVLWYKLQTSMPQPDPGQEHLYPSLNRKYSDAGLQAGPRHVLSAGASSTTARRTPAKVGFASSY
jgi:hypothetical protein